jgi:hypothetical protein
MKSNQDARIRSINIHFLYKKDFSVCAKTGRFYTTNRSLYRLYYGKPGSPDRIRENRCDIFLHCKL